MEETLALVPYVPSLLSQMYNENTTIHIAGEINQTYHLQQGGHGTGSIIWHASYLLSQFLATITKIDNYSNNYTLPLEYFTWKGKRVIELGAGLGVLSITLSLLNVSQIITTDGESSVTRYLERNLKTNTKLKNWTVLSYLWGTSTDTLQDVVGEQPVDAIIAADVVYGEDMETWNALENTLINLCSHTQLKRSENEQYNDKKQHEQGDEYDITRETPVVNSYPILYIAQTHRYEREKLFFRRLERSFDRLAIIPLSHASDTTAESKAHSSVLAVDIYNVENSNEVSTSPLVTADECSADQCHVAVESVYPTRGCSLFIYRMKTK